MIFLSSCNRNYEREKSLLIEERQIGTGWPVVTAELAVAQ